MVFASLFESTLFLNHSEPYPLIDFKVDYIGHYFPFYVNTPVGNNFQAWHFAAVALIFLSILSPFIWNALKWRFSLLAKILSS